MVKGTTHWIVMQVLQMSLETWMVGQPVTDVSLWSGPVKVGRSKPRVAEGSIDVSLRVMGGLVGRVSWIVWARAGTLNVC